MGKGGAAEPLLTENRPTMGGQRWGEGSGGAAPCGEPTNDGGEANDGGAKGIINMLSKLFELSKTLKI